MQPILLLHLYQISQSVTSGVPATDAEITARATALAANDDDNPPDGPWPAAIQNASMLLWVKRLAAETAMKRLRAKLDAVDAQFPLEGEAEKSLWKINDKGENVTSPPWLIMPSGGTPAQRPA